ncbi:MAG TPA: DUF2878 domain-containing protein [Dokdonella sp.]
MSRRADVWINAIVFEIVWLAAVGGAGHGLWWAGPLALSVFFGYQVRASPLARADGMLVALACAVGFLADSMLALSGLVGYASPLPSAHFAPLWIVALWANLALTLNHSLAFLQERLPLAAVLGAIAAPLSYFFAEQAWHAVVLAPPLATTLLVLAASWAVLMPLLVAAARRLRSRSMSAGGVRSS